jgi:hypothetical protein
MQNKFINKVIAIAAVLILFQIHCYAEEVGSVHFWSPECQSWINDSGNQKIAHKIYALGYLKGLETESFKARQELLLFKLENQQELFDFLDKYCVKNSRAPIEFGINQFATELRRR